MSMLKVQKLDPNALLPTCANPGEDLGYDLYALEDALLLPHKLTKVRTGIAAHYHSYDPQYGLLIRDRSSMAAKGITVSGGVVDAGYRGEVVVMLTLNPQTQDYGYAIKRGEKIAQMIPMPVLTENGVMEVETLPESARGEKGFGSTGK